MQHYFRLREFLSVYLVWICAKYSVRFCFYTCTEFSVYFCLDMHEIFRLFLVRHAWNFRCFRFRHARNVMSVFPWHKSWFSFNLHEIFCLFCLDMDEIFCVFAGQILSRQILLRHSRVANVFYLTWLCMECSVWIQMWAILGYMTFPFWFAVWMCAKFLFWLYKQEYTKLSFWSCLHVLVLEFLSIFFLNNSLNLS